MSASANMGDKKAENVVLDEDFLDFHFSLQSWRKEKYVVRKAHKQRGRPVGYRLW